MVGSMQDKANLLEMYYFLNRLLGIQNSLDILVFRIIVQVPDNRLRHNQKLIDMIFLFFRQKIPREEHMDLLYLKQFVIES